MLPKHGSETSVCCPSTIILVVFLSVGSSQPVSVSDDVMCVTDCVTSGMGQSYLELVQGNHCLCIQSCDSLHDMSDASQLTVMESDL